MDVFREPILVKGEVDAVSGFYYTVLGKYICKRCDCV